jgi:hypothetical protein
VFTVFFALFAGSAFADTPPGDGKPPSTPPAPPTPPTHVTMTREEYDALKAGQKKEGGGDGGGGDGDDPLLKKVADQKRQRQKTEADSKAIETAIGFNYGLDTFIKDNKDLLPEEISDAVAQSAKETYDSAAQKAAAVKKAIIGAYFKQQANVDMLTASQRASLDDYNKLTNTGKEEQAPTIFANLFEPCLEMQRRIRKAEELARGRNGSVQSSSSEAAYRDRLIKGSRKKYLGEKE